MKTNDNTMNMTTNFVFNIQVFQGILKTTVVNIPNIQKTVCYTAHNLSGQLAVLFILKQSE